jgi:hypothetical protein
LIQGPNGYAQTKSKWIPDHAKLQFAGNIGFFSLGLGYASRRETWEGDLYYGYVPESVGGLTIHSMTLKSTWFPIHPFNRKNFQLKPLSLGLLVNYTFGKQYFGFTPENYPYDYYGFPTSLHVGAFAGGQVNLNHGGRIFKSTGIYYEVGTIDRQLLSYINNTGSLRPGNVLSLALGLKTGF